MVVFPISKINLGLNILRKRKDGYHDISTCFYPVPYTDILEILPGKGETTFAATGLAIPGYANDNICIKAWELVDQKHGIGPVRIHLHKIIPTGAGLGGGSSDAAYTLKVLNDLFELRLTTELLAQYALELGSDCPFFIEGKPVLASGRGEMFESTNFSLSGYYLVLLYPAVHVSTAMAYAGVKPGEPIQTLRSILGDMPVDSWRGAIKNDFEESVFEKFPKLSTLKQVLYEAGALYASMSGSGSSVYGIFTSEPTLPGDLPVVWQGILP